MIKILFICHGNICRSTMAEFVMKELVRRDHLEDAYEIASAATSREEIGNDTTGGRRSNWSSTTFLTRPGKPGR